MFKVFVCICLTLCATGSTIAQEATQSENTSDVSKSYVVQLTEYRFEQPLRPSQSAAEILELLAATGDSKKAEIVETVRLSTLSGTESMVQFGRRVSVTVGKATTRGGETVRQKQGYDVGTVVRLTARPQDDKVAMALTFDSSRIGEEVDEDSPPDVIKTQISSTLLLELGKPSLVGSSTQASSRVIVVTVTEN